MRKLLFLILSFSLIACAKTAFTVDSSSLRRSVDISLDCEGDIISYHEIATISAMFSDNDLKYAFQIKSPDRDLVWEGDFSTESVELGLTAGASFPSGDYPIIFYGDNGTEIISSLSLPAIDDVFPYISKGGFLVSDYKIAIVEYDDSGNEIKRDNGAEEGYKISQECSRVDISFTDRYLNRIRIKQDII